MAGGTWAVQNKVRAGTYINFESTPKPSATVGDRGVMTMALPLSWGEPKTVIALTAGDDMYPILGYDYTHPNLRLIREALKRAKTVLLYRLNDGEKASAVLAPLTVGAKYSGERGNDLSVVVQKNMDNESLYDVITQLDGEEVDAQTVSNINGLRPNDWVTFSGTGTPVETAGIPLVGGTDGNVTNANHTNYLTEIELYDFHTMALVSSDVVLKSVYVAFVKRLREDEGRNFQLVVENYPLADYEGVISVKNGVILADGATLTAVQTTVWVAGATAGAHVNESLTFQPYEDAVDVVPRYTNSQIITAINNGEFVFTQKHGSAIVEKDINTFTSVTPSKDTRFSRNRVIRTRDGLSNDFQKMFELTYIGKVDNNEDGRNIFRGSCIRQAEVYQSINAIQNFDAQNDIEVVSGSDSDAIFIGMQIQEVDAIEKVYMRVRLK